MKTNPNESAYPYFKVDEDGIEYVDPGMTGLTKREYFAAMALNGICSNVVGRTKETIVKTSVEMADALIKELNKE